MTSTFYRLHTDATQVPAPLDDLFAGPVSSACWLVGGGPSLNHLPHEAINESPIPKMCINLAGSRLLRPTFWTSYDPSARFHRSVYLDPGIMKFVHRRRSMDLVPECTFKVCECPNTFFFDRDGERGYHNFLAPTNAGIVDWADTMVQAIDILYRLGFRTIYLVGCEMRVRPSDAQVHRAAQAGVTYDPQELLHTFLNQTIAAGVSQEELDHLEPGQHYHFGESKQIRAAANTDMHYFRVVQYLRLSRRALALAGVRLISATPHSRLHDHFPYQSVDEIVGEIKQVIGDPQAEPLKGMYHQVEPRHPRQLGPMRDFRPHNWRSSPEANPSPRPATPPRPNLPQDAQYVAELEGYQQLPPGNGRATRRQRLQLALDRLPQELADPIEEG